MPAATSVHYAILIGLVELGGYPPVPATLCGYLVGGVIGARTAVKRGSRFVRVVFLTVVALLLIKLGHDVLWH